MQRKQIADIILEKLAANKKQLSDFYNASNSAIAYFYIDDVCYVGVYIANVFVEFLWLRPRWSFVFNLGNQCKELFLFLTLKNLLILMLTL